MRFTLHKSKGYRGVINLLKSDPVITFDHMNENTTESEAMKNSTKFTSSIRHLLIEELAILSMMALCVYESL